MQNDPDQATKPMGDGPDGLIVSEARDESTIDNLENGPFRLGCGVGTLIENASHVAVSFRGGGGLLYPPALFLSQARSPPTPQLPGGKQSWLPGTPPPHSLLFPVQHPAPPVPP